VVALGSFALRYVATGYCDVRLREPDDASVEPFDVQARY
jgi:hypothetical protein